MFAAAAKQPAAYDALRLLQQGSLLALQPLDVGGSSVDTLSVDLASGAVEVTTQPAFGSAAEEVLALAGVFKFTAGTVAVVVTGARQVAVLFGAPVLLVTKTRVIRPPGARFDAGEARLLALLSDALCPTGTGRNMFYSPGADLTLHAQARAAALSDPKTAAGGPCARAERRFWWNRTLARPVVEAGGAAFVHTWIQGFVGQVANLPVAKAGGGGAAAAPPKGGTRQLELTLVARRSADRSGTRHWRRGADAQGAVANFVESEQLVVLDGGRLLASFVQVRGSIPLLWTQLPNIKYKPPTKVLDGAATSAAFDAHFADLAARYGAVTAINLVNQHGSEGTLAQRFRVAAARFAGVHPSPPLHYVAFDFHKECGAKDYHRLSLLWDQVVPDFARDGLFRQVAGVVEGRQTGLMRVNCIDCLDRTNVVEALLGRKALEAVLGDAAVGVLAPGVGLHEGLPELEARFKIVWADHGDAISQQYAGTGALKSGFTRTGKRTFGGLIDDGVKSIARYYLNNFQDGSKQDALDLLSGAYALKADVKVIFRRNASPALPLLAAAACLVFALHSLSAAAHGGGFDVGALALRVVAPLAVAAGLVLLVQRFGRQLVLRPQLAPHLANTVSAAAEAEGGGGAR